MGSNCTKFHKGKSANEILSERKTIKSEKNGYYKGPKGLVWILINITSILFWKLCSFVLKVFILNTFLVLKTFKNKVIFFYSTSLKLNL